MLRKRRFPLAFYGGVVCEVGCKVSDWLTYISQRTKRTVVFCRRGQGREGIGTSMMMQYYSGLHHQYMIVLVNGER